MTLWCFSTRYNRVVHEGMGSVVIFLAGEGRKWPPWAPYSFHTFFNLNVHSHAFALDLTYNRRLRIQDARLWYHVYMQLHYVTRIGPLFRAIPTDLLTLLPHEFMQ